MGSLLRYRDCAGSDWGGVVLATSQSACLIQQLLSAFLQAACCHQASQLSMRTYCCGAAAPPNARKLLHANMRVPPCMEPSARPEGMLLLLAALLLRCGCTLLLVRGPVCLQLLDLIKATSDAGAAGINVMDELQVRRKAICQTVADRRSCTAVPVGCDLACACQALAQTILLQPQCQCCKGCIGGLWVEATCAQCDTTLCSLTFRRQMMIWP